MRHERSAAPSHTQATAALRQMMGWPACLERAGGGVWPSWGSTGWSLGCSPRPCRGFPGRGSSAGSSLAARPAPAGAPAGSLLSPLRWLSRRPLPHAGSWQGWAEARWWCASWSHPSSSPRALLALHPSSVVRGPSRFLPRCRGPVAHPPALCSGGRAGRLSPVCRTSSGSWRHRLQLVGRPRDLKPFHAHPPPPRPSPRCRSVVRGCGRR